METQVTPETTMRDLKARCDLKGYQLSFKGTRNDGIRVADLGIQPGETISAIRTGYTPGNQASWRKKTGRSKVSRVHDVVEAVMNEGGKVSREVADVGAGVKKLADDVKTIAKDTVELLKPVISENTQPNPGLVEIAHILHSDVSVPA